MSYVFAVVDHISEECIGGEPEDKFTRLVPFCRSFIIDKQAKKPINVLKLVVDDRADEAIKRAEALFT